MAWLSGWSNRVKLTIDNTNINADLINYPLPVNLALAPLPLSSYIGRDVPKMAITTSDGETECYFYNKYIRNSNNTDYTGDCWIWIKIPIIYTNQSTVLYVYYNGTHDNIYSESSHNIFNSTNNTVGYWSFDNSQVDGISYDSSERQNNLSYTGYFAIDQGINQNCIKNTISATDSGYGVPVYSISNGYSISGWVNNVKGTIYEEKNPSNQSLFRISADEYGNSLGWKAHVKIVDASGTTILDRVSTISYPYDNEWIHIAWSDVRGNAKLFINGVEDTYLDYNSRTQISSFIYQIPSPAPTVTLDTLILNCLTGISSNAKLDEWTVYNAAKSTAWLQADCYRFRDSSYIGRVGQESIRIYWATEPPTPTTTTTTTATTGTTTPTTTTTTTAPKIYKVLTKVETVEVRNGISYTEQDGSDNESTINTIFSDSLELGPIAPGETCATKIIYLRVPSATSIQNIKLSLIGTGGITFVSSIFGVETQNYLDYNLIPSSYFQGVNSDKSSTSIYNISIPNNGLLQSQYVYLNVSLPMDQTFEAGTIRLKWFFDYNSGVASTENI